MNADLEELVRTSDAEMAAFVRALRAAPQARVEADFAARVRAGLRQERRRRSLWSVVGSRGLFAAAAALVVLLAFGTTMLSRTGTSMTVAQLAACQQADGSFSSSTAAPYVQAFAVTALAEKGTSQRPVLEQAVASLIRAQQADGGWGNAQLSARNVAALSLAAQAGLVQVRDAVRRGIRYLHTQGIPELSKAELVAEAKVMLPRLHGSTDVGLASGLALCARH